MEITEDLVERLAQEIHRRYVTRRRADGADAQASVMVEWADLPEAKRESNRAQARDIPLKLQAVGCELAPTAGTPFAFTPDEIDRLTHHEQERWYQHHATTGWSYGAVRDDVRKQHPRLVTWDRLPKAEQDKDREVVEGLPAILAAVGLHIVRTPR